MAHFVFAAAAKGGAVVVPGGAVVLATASVALGVYYLFRPRKFEDYRPPPVVLRRPFVLSPLRILEVVFASRRSADQTETPVRRVNRAECKERGDNSGEENRGTGDGPQDPRRVDLPKEDYSTWDLDRLLSALRDLLNTIRVLGSTGMELTRQERDALLTTFLGLLEVLIDRFNVQFYWEGDTIGAEVQGQRITFSGVNSEIFDLESFLQPPNNEELGDLRFASNVIYGFRCIRCNPRQYRYVGLTSGSIRTRAANHRSRMTRRSRSRSPSPAGRNLRMPMADHAFEHFEQHGSNVDDTYEVDVLKRVPNGKNLRSWEVVFQWLLRTRIKDGGFNIR